jgi:hypothetical protein
MKNTVGSDARSIVDTYHRCWTSRRFDESIQLLAPDLAVEVPINEYPTRESFAEALVTRRTATIRSSSPSRPPPTACSTPSRRSTGYELGGPRAPAAPPRREGRFGSRSTAWTSTSICR